MDPQNRCGRSQTFGKKDRRVAVHDDADISRRNQSSFNE